MHIVLATRNRKKVEEMRRMCRELNVEISSAGQFPGCPEVEEDGKTFRANAVKKARAISQWTNLPALADDSGLEVDALGGAPGIFSSRYAGEGASDINNVRKLLKDMKETNDRNARFVCCLALVFPDGTWRTFSGVCKGTIGRRRKGSNGFGYDPVFLPEGYQKTFAEMTDSQKDCLSHRGKALRKLFRYLRKNI